MLATVDRNEAEERLSNQDISSSASECKFLDFENGWGLKCYDSYDSYRTAFIAQKFAAKCGKAPLVGETMVVAGHYCYVTEVLDVVSEYRDDCAHPDIEDLDCDVQEDCDEAIQEFNSHFEDVFADHGARYFRDRHAGNFGYNSSGKCLIIDFDTCWSLARKVEERDGDMGCLDETESDSVPF